MNEGRIQVFAQCISAVATTVAAIAAAYTAYLVYGQLDAATITLHTDTQYKMYDAVLTSSQALSGTSNELRASKADVVNAARRKLKVQVQAFDGLIAEVHSEFMARALDSPSYFWLLYQICPGFKNQGYSFDGEPLNAVGTACHDLDEHMAKE